MNKLKALVTISRCMHHRCSVNTCELIDINSLKQKSSQYDFSCFFFFSRIRIWCYCGSEFICSNQLWVPNLRMQFPTSIKFSLWQLLDIKCCWDNMKWLIIPNSQPISNLLWERLTHMENRYIFIKRILKDYVTHCF